MPDESSAKPEGASVSPPHAAQPKPDGKKPEAQQLLSPHQNAVAIGAHRERKERAGAVVAAVGGKAPNLGEYSWQHDAAAALHGWGGPGLTEGHEHHEGKPIQLSTDDYKAALLAASAPVTRALEDFDVGEFKGKKGEKVDSHKAAALGIPVHTDYEPHKPALSKHAPHVKASEAAAAEKV